MPNRIREHRRTLKLTQKDLADLLGTTRQHVQRIEVGEFVKLDLAFRICAALKRPIEDVFPPTKKAIAILQKNGSGKNCKPHPEADRLMGEAGIDVDPADWTVQFRLRNGLEGMWCLSSKEVDRLVRRAQFQENVFFCSQSRMTAFAVNLRHLSFFHLRFGFNEVAEKDVEQKEEVSVYLANSAKPLEFDVAPDPEPPTDDLEDEGPFRNLLHDLEAMDEYPQADPVIDFVDLDGEQAFFRTEQVALIEIPLGIIHPEMEDESNDRI
ncbi:MAG TPA: helix-turn-helix domain-containing protein [Verrucomicrobiota bacterium]|nr:helix-turn-helix domain-containing protein [Verrucomicrobiota bacterium]HPC51805.1 helix-turn-helix domain-containing protein [Verrucomicrobiota bacterium]HPL35764.1 helix-turn-helix domain-containing protein [Verrucomicrobiota bacterium]HQH53240.1 helix-turn-helix domain-containing protein [Candidatus Hydrogenedentota bacterium]HRV39030.1 helix-turn-helix domain-containing protein [Candidatus Paceibacterota bacterium]